MKYKCGHCGWVMEYPEEVNIDVICSNCGISIQKCKHIWIEDPKNVLNLTDKQRKECPVYSGVIKYFPDALMAVANHSFKGNEKHNPGTELHWDRSKSGDELDALVRHIIDGDWVAVAWRALANLQKKMEEGYNPINNEN